MIAGVAGVCQRAGYALVSKSQWEWLEVVRKWDVLCLVSDSRSG